MGCHNAKIENASQSMDNGGSTSGLSQPSKMGSDFAKTLSSTTRDYASGVWTDSRNPLDARQVFKIKQSWRGIRRCMEATGLEMFVR